MAENISMKARPYQLGLVEHLCKQNGILYLPTGAGKTFIAILVLDRLSSALKDPISKGGKRTVFMCNTVELARQQCAEIQKCVNLTVGLYIGDKCLDSWKYDQWKREFDEKQVLVGTAQIFVDCVTQNFLKVSDLNLVIIDECHHATKDHPMHTFLNLIKTSKSEQPRIVGLTGVLIKGNKLNKIEVELKRLEAAFSGRIVTIRTLEEFNNVMLYSTKPIEHLIQYPTIEIKFKVESKIKAIAKNWIDTISSFNANYVKSQLNKALTKSGESCKKKSIKNLIEDLIYQMDNNGLYCALIVATTLLFEFQIKKRGVHHDDNLRNVYRYCIKCCDYIRHILLAEFKATLKELGYSSNYIEDSMCDTKSIILKYSTPKLTVLLRTLTETFKGKTAEDITALVFVHRRSTAHCLYYVLKNYLNECPELNDVIKPQCFVGHTSTKINLQFILEKKWNHNIMHMFRNKKYNLIICSNVLEEGIDVQACNYVFVVDELLTFNSYIQTKGRARSQMATYTIFCNESNLQATSKKIIMYRVAHESIKVFLMERVLSNDNCHTDEVCEELNAIIPPFEIPSGAKLVAPSAISLLNRYCNALPCDSFGSVLPWFYTLQTEGGYQVALQLPLQSTLKDTIIGDVMRNLKQAKMSAAFKACKQLYYLGELNDHLLPISKTECIEKVTEEFFQNWKQYSENEPESKFGHLIGKKHLRLYDIKCPFEFYNAMPQVGQKCYAYAIKFFVQFKENSYNAHVVRYLNTKATFAFLLKKRLPPLAEMPLFMSQGKLHVQIAEQPIECMIHSNEQLETLVRFHIMIFKDLLKLWEPLFVIDRRNKENAYLIVPINSSDHIDWNLVINNQCLRPSQSYTLNKENEQIYHPEDFLDKIVSKCYNDKPHENFAVIKIRQDLNPMSSFSQSNFKDYVDYYKKRYNKNVRNKTQFLLEVKAFTQRRIFFNNALGKSLEIHKDNTEILLIPELCNKYDIPANMWLKALFLPSIIHRVYYMLHAESLRQRINKYLDLDKYFTQYKPSPLIVDTSLKRAVNDITKLKQYQSRKDSKMLLKDFGKENLNTVNIPWESLPLNKMNLYTNACMNNKYHLDILKFKYAFELQSAEQHEFLAAITTAVVNDVFDMERFELLGDAYLKFSVSLFLANRFPNWNEGFLSMLKGRIVSNQNLWSCLLKMEICNCICGSQFEPYNTEWLPPLISLPSNLLELLANSNSPIIMDSTDFRSMQLSEEEIRTGICSQKILTMYNKINKKISDKADNTNINMNKFLYKEIYRDKVMADVLEALLGVCVKNYGIDRTFKMLEFFGILKSDPAFPLTNLLHMKFNFGRLRCNIKHDDIDELLVHGHILEKKLRYKFHDRAYLLQAVTHPSNPTNRLTGSYQELEFIGDAILDMLITCYIFERNRHMTPGMMTDMRMALVNNVTLACVCVRHSFHLYMLYENTLLSESIKNFVEFQKTQNYRVTDQMRVLMEQAWDNSEDNKQTYFEKTFNNCSDERTQCPNTKKVYNLSENVDVPKALGDVVEALIAAVYLDCRDLRTTWRVIYDLLEPEIIEFSDHVPIDPVRELNENTSANAHFSKATNDNDVFMMKCSFNCKGKTIEVNGFGSNTKQAKKAASKHALRILKERNK